MQPSWPAVFVVAAIVNLQSVDVKSEEPGKALPAADAITGKKAGEVRDDNGLKMKLIWCPPGFFKMETFEVISEPAPTQGNAGQKTIPSDDDFDEVDRKIESDSQVPKQLALVRKTPKKPRLVKVSLTTGYWLGKFEVTQSEWKSVMNTEPWMGWEFAKEGMDIAATFVNWTDAIEFCGKLTEMERQAGRLPNDWEYTLPTEAQWERACRARTETRFSFGDDDSKLDDHAWFANNTAGERYAHPVGQKKANSWGLCDMHGNVREYCRDIYTPILPGGRDPEVEQNEQDDGTHRVIRGGAWNSNAALCRAGYRSSTRPGQRSAWNGFRVALRSVH